MQLSSIFAAWTNRGIFLRTALLMVALLLFGCGGSPSTDQTRAVRLPSQKPAATDSTVAEGGLYAVVVGVAKYSHSKISQLKFADKDAKDFAAFLDSQKRLFRKTQVRSLVNQEATRVEIEKCLADLSLAGENDTVIVYLSGHGSDDLRSPGQFFFLPYDADPDYLGPSCVNMSRQEYLQKLPSKRVLLLADTCHSGGFPTQTTRGIEPAFERFVRQIKDTKGRIVLSASRADEASIEKAELSNGVFTYYLLEGLRGAADANHDGVVTLHELYTYVHEKTKDSTRGVQHPRIIGDLDGPFPMSLARLEPSSVPVPQPSSQPATVQLPPTEMDRLRTQAEAGDAKAQFELGVKYEFGFGVTKDPAEALKWYCRASEKGISDAKAAIARLTPRRVAPSASPSRAGTNFLPAEIESLEMGSNPEAVLGRIKNSGSCIREEVPNKPGFQLVWTPPKGSYYQTVAFVFAKKDRLYMIRFTLADPRRDAGKLKKAFFDGFGFNDHNPSRFTRKSTDTLLYGPDKSYNFLFFEQTDTKTGQKSFELFRRGIFGQDTMKQVPAVE